MKFDLKKYKLYEVLTLVALCLGIALLWISWLSVFLILTVITQYEFVNIQVSVILRQSVMLKKKEITEIRLTRFQSWLSKVFAA